MLFSGRELRAHMDDDRRSQEKIERALDDMQKSTSASFDKVRTEVQERHAENQAGLARLYTGLWKVALTIMGALLLNYLAAHGFKVGP